MRLTRRGKILIGGITAVVGVVAASTILALTGKGPAPIRKIGEGIVGNHTEAPPPTCPLTGVELKGKKHSPNRPALAIKVENLPEARPQAGLNAADIVYEEPVEGGITRFIVIYQCNDSDRVGPVRSARLTDPQVLTQYGSPVFGYAGGVPQVMQAVRDAGLKDENYNIAVDAYIRDPNRDAPHDLYTNTPDLWKAAHQHEAPDPVFEYDTDKPEHARKIGFAHLDFSGSSDVYWRWDKPHQRWLRFHGTEPHMLEGDVQVSAKNVVVQIVGIKYTGISDVAGSPSPEAITVGSGKAYVFRSGKMIKGTWSRDAADSTTQFVSQSGDIIKLAPGNTWVELYPDDRPKIETGK